jgi:hypothetical protein
MSVESMGGGHEFHAMKMKTIFNQATVIPEGNLMVQNGNFHFNQSNTGLHFFL